MVEVIVRGEIEQMAQFVRTIPDIDPLFYHHRRLEVLEEGLELPETFRVERPRRRSPADGPFWLTDKRWQRQIQIVEYNSSEILAIGGGELKPVEPIAFDCNGTTLNADHVSWGTYLTLVSERVVTAFREARLTGWDTFDVEVRGKRGVRIPGFVGVAVTGRFKPGNTDGRVWLTDWGRKKASRLPAAGMTTDFAQLEGGAVQWISG